MEADTSAHGIQKISSIPEEQVRMESIDKSNISKHNV